MSAPAVAPQVTSDFGLLSDDDEKTIETSLPPSPRSPATPQRGLTRELKRYNVMGIRFDVDVRYDVLDVVGQGAYGVVCAAHDAVAGEAVAIKKIANAFEHATYTKRTLREIRLLRLLRHDNIVRLKTLLPPVKSDGFRDLYIISDLLETDLSSVIKSPQPLSDEHVQFFIYQVLRGVKFLHTCTPPVTHRDLKPRNLLVNSNCDLKICDFGLARVDVQSSSAAAMTDYVATCVEINQCVGCTKSFLGDDAALMTESESFKTHTRHAIEQASRRWRKVMIRDAPRQFDFHTGGYQMVSGARDHHGLGRVHQGRRRLGGRLHPS
jgi:serine/threonine protein kinase